MNPNQYAYQLANVTDLVPTLARARGTLADLRRLKRQTDSPLDRAIDDAERIVNAASLAIEHQDHCGCQTPATQITIPLTPATLVALILLADMHTSLIAASNMDDPQAQEGT